jgi:uncharacterized protein with HEPN domain
LSRSDVQRLRDAREAADHALKYRELSVSQLAEHADERHSVLYCLIVIGETLNWIPADIQSLAPEIQWRQIIDMRHILVHAYWRTDYSIVQTVVERDLDPLIASIDRLLQVLEKD